MNYLEFLKSEIDNVEITEEVNFNYSGVGTVLVVKHLAGSNFKDSTVVPVQLAVYTDDIKHALALFNTFSKVHNDTFFIDDFTYVRQFYQTPVVMNNFNQMGDNYNSFLILAGTLVMSDNVSDIQKVIIDGVEYTTTTRKLSYVGALDNQRTGYVENINNTNITHAQIKFTCTLVHKGSALTEKLRRIRTNNENINTLFNIKLVYTQNAVEEVYSMKLDSHIVDSENQMLPLLSLSFMR